MSFYSRKVVPWMIRRSCGAKPIRKQREKVVPLARGKVLEIGAGGGMNLPFYDPARVEKVLGLDISPELLADAEAEAGRAGLAFEPVLLDAATIPLEPDSIDTALVTYSLCSIDNLASALAEMRRVLKPDGRLIFCEHARAPDAGVARVQDMLTPAWRRFGGGCRLNRRPVVAIEAAGFSIDWQDEMYLPGTWRMIGWNEWGVARL